MFNHSCNENEARNGSEHKGKDLDESSDSNHSHLVDLVIGLHDEFDVNSFVLVSLWSVRSQHSSFVYNISSFNVLKESSVTCEREVIWLTYVRSRSEFEVDMSSDWSLKACCDVLVCSKFLWCHNTLYFRPCSWVFIHIIPNGHELESEEVEHSIAVCVNLKPQ